MPDRSFDGKLGVRNGGVVVRGCFVQSRIESRILHIVRAYIYI